MIVLILKMYIARCEFNDSIVVELQKCLRGYSISRLYFDIGDFDTCVRYLTQYLTVKDNNAVAHNLLGQAYRKLGRKEEALAEFKTSLELDSSQNSLILKGEYLKV